MFTVGESNIGLLCCTCVYVLSVIEISARFVIVIRDVKNVFFVSEIFREIFKYFFVFFERFEKSLQTSLGYYSVSAEMHLYR